MKGDVTLPSTFLKLSPSLLFSYAPPYLPPKPKSLPAEVTFEEAIALTGQGSSCQWRIVIVSGLCILSSICETVGVAYFLPYARCDLRLTPADKTLLGGAASAGMTVASMVWGAVADSWGRRPVLLTALFLDVAVGMLSSIAPSLYILLFLRFLCGICASGPSAVAYAFLGEYHGEASRAKAVCISGLFVAAAVIILPAAAWAVLPIQLDVPLPWGGNFSSWRLYLVMQSIPGLITACLIVPLDETPRFQLSRGREEEAINTLASLYEQNTGIPKHEYPVKRLRTDEVAKPPTRIRKGPFSALLNVWDQMLPLFRTPYLPTLVLCCVLQAGSFLCANGLLIWLPDIFVRTASPDLSSSRICEALELSPLPTLLHQGDEDYTCDSSTVDTTAFSNALIIGGTVGMAYILTAILSGSVRKRVLFGSLTLCGSALGFGMAPSRPSWVTLALTSVYHGFMGVSITILGGLVADLFPTRLRAASLSVSLTFGRIGMVGGATALGVLLETSCASAFHTAGAVALVISLLSLLLPKTNHEETPT